MCAQICSNPPLELNSKISILPGGGEYSKSENFDWSVVAVLRVKEGRQILVAVRLAAPMTANAEEENNPPEMAMMLYLVGSPGRALGSNPTPVEVITILTLS